MRHLIHVFACLILVCLLLPGCGEPKPKTAANNNNNNNSSSDASNQEEDSRERDNLQIGGVPNPQGDDQGNQDKNADGNQAGAQQGNAGLGNDDNAGGNTAQQNNQNTNNRRNNRRNGRPDRPPLQIGGVPGGGAPGPSPEERRRMNDQRNSRQPLNIAGVPRGANQNNNRPNRPNNNSGNGTFAGGGLPNGFYPQPGGAGGSFDASGTLNNGFYPQSSGNLGNGGTFVSVPATVSPSAKMLSDAVSAFQERDEQKAFKHLYAHVLTSDQALEKYPIRWYDKLSQPRLAFRWGIGVIYTNKSADETPLVVGDPTGIRESESRGRNSRRGGGGGRSGGGGVGGFEGGGSSRQSSSSNSDYAQVNTEHPEGFLLYYTGDFGDRLLDRLESRRKHQDGFYGDILRDIDVDYSGEASENVDPVRNRPRGNQADRRSRDNLGVGGVPRGGGGNNNRGGGAQPAERSERLKRVLTSSTSVKPAGDTTGTLIPGVMLVGEGKKDDLIERAKSMGLDGLLLFKCTVKSGRRSTGLANVKVINLHAADKSDEEVFSSRSLKTDKVAEYREESSDDSRDPVELALDSVFKDMADLHFKANALPPGLKTNPEAVKRRVKSLIDPKPAAPLPVLVEIMSYYKQGLVDKETASQSISQLLGGVLGKMMVDGNEQQRFDIVRKYLAGGGNNASSFR